ncbi:dihydrodipicolinate synthase family protein [Enterobacter hormaechei]|uniref:dihydrodipicolinate synthase family protein n=1 Tax=Enterobacter hormaechei TaxID=158836 RepID=UPI003CF8AF82
MQNLSGVTTVATTPFKQTGEIDYCGFSHNLEFYAQNSDCGVIVAGTMGEYSAMSLEERKTLFEFAAKKLNGRCPLMAAAISTTTRQVIELSKHVSDQGGSGILLFSHPGQGLQTHELLDFYIEVADATDIDIMLYNYPSSNGIDLPFELLKQLSEHPRIVAIKECTNDVKRFSRIADELHGKLTAICGFEDLHHEAFQAGARGWVCLGGNFAPGMVKNLLEFVQAGRMKEADRLVKNYQPLARYFESTSKSIQATKYVMDRTGLIGGYCRRPRLPLSPEEKSEINHILRQVELY